MLRLAEYFDVGDLVLYGKYKNKKGKIVRFDVDPKSGDPIVVIEPVPKGRKQNKEIKLYKIRHNPASEKGQKVQEQIEKLKTARRQMARSLVTRYLKRVEARSRWGSGVP
jgi:hypothetical protein